ncbi:MAG: tRNA pseudouridine(55) synthase TruB [Negativicutes bacterium]|jgi:tRNA pseudouridine55 synthase
MLNGVINIIKPPGMTSHDVVSVVRKLSNTRRVGHAGTLDPAAAGILPVFIGNATRFIEYFPDDKEYFAEIIFGCETDTCDDTGTEISRCEIPHIEPLLLQNILKTFTGRIEQQPPIFSAIKVNGKKLYEYARSGQDVIIKRRLVDISRIELTGTDANIARVIVNCSSGTYIRSLCRDVGRALSIPSMMGFLLRSRVGVFSLANAVTMEQVAENIHELTTPVERLLELFLPKISLQHGDAVLFQDGRRLITTMPIIGTCIVSDEKENFCGVAVVERGVVIAKKVVRSELLHN